MAYTTIRLETRGAVGWIVLNRPEAYNAMNSEMMAEMREATRSVAADPGLRALVITGEGKAFCAGGDVAGYHKDLDSVPEKVRERAPLLQDLILGIALMDKPVLAAINGVAAGVGLALALAPDLAIASERARFIPAFTGIGVAPDGGASWMLPRLVGMRRAMEMTLLNRTLDAREALEWGLVNSVANADLLQTETEALANRLASGPTLAYGAAKRLLRASYDTTLNAHMKSESDAFVAMTRTEDFREGVRAFMEKRKPGFHGGAQG